MINLLPENEKKILVKEYKFRLLALILIFILLAILLSILLLGPSAVLAIYRERATQQRAATVDTTETPEHLDLEAKLARLRHAAVVLAPDTNVPLPSVITSLLIIDKPSTIAITEINYQTVKDGTLTVAVTGTAGTRQDLVTFTEALKKEKGITSVDLPVSNLARDANFPYTFTITTGSSSSHT